MERARTTGGTILFADDNDELRRAAARLLQQGGYEVLEASDGVEALALARERPSGISLVITDVVMPNLGGRALFDALQELPNPPRFIFSSGYHQPEALAGIAMGARARFLAKPWNAHELMSAVHRMFEDDAPEPGGPSTPAPPRDR